MDSQSVKNTDTADSKGYDAGKKVSGIKRHLAVDTPGLPHGIHVTTANVTDRAGALAMFDRCRDGLSQVQNVLVDGGYIGKPFATAVQSLLGAAVEVVKRSELHTFVVLPKRWVVERSFAWLEKCRRLWKNCERKLNTSRQLRDRHAEPLTVIWDNAPARRGDALRTYLTTPGLRLRLVNLPSYSPDFNADEAIWGWVRQEVTANWCLGTKAAVQEKVGNFFIQLADRKAEVKQRCRTVLQAYAEGMLRKAQADTQRSTNVDSTLASV